MLEQYFLRPTTVDRIRSNWLAPQIEHYVEWMHAQKYAKQNITRRIALLCHFADFARINGATDLASATSLVEKFGDHWMADNRCWNLDTLPKLRRDICSIIRQMLLLILEGRVTRERGHPPFQFQSEAPGFFKYLLEERGMKNLFVCPQQTCVNPRKKRAVPTASFICHLQARAGGERGTAPEVEQWTAA